MLGYIVLTQGVRMEDKRIVAVKNWPKPMSVRDIQMFIGFANFYQRFIQGFSRIAALLTLKLKATRLSKESAPKVFKTGKNEVFESSDRANETVVDSSKFKNKKSKKLTRMPNIGAIGEPNLLTPNTKKAFYHLRLAFIKALILQYFDLESYIWIETNASSYAIGEIFG